MAVCPLNIVFDGRPGKRVWSGSCRLCDARMDDGARKNVFDWFAQHVCCDPVRRDGWMPRIRAWQATVDAKNAGRE